MAKRKKKVDVDTSQEAYDKMIDNMIDNSETITLTDPDAEKIWISSGNVAINMACTAHPARCVQMGKIVNLEGESDTGKTLLALTIIREAQRAYGDNLRFLIIDSERGMDPARTASMGLNVNKRSIIQTTDMTELAEVIMPNFQNMARADSDRIYICLIDSMSMLVTAHERDTEFGKKNIQRANDFGKFMRLLNDRFPPNLLILCVHHQYDRISTGGALSSKTGHHGKDIGGGKKSKYVPDARLEIDYAGKAKELVNGKEKIIGQECRIKVIKSRWGIPMTEARVLIDHKVGFTVTSGMFDMMMDHGLIIPEGKMFRCEEIFGDKKFYKTSLNKEMEKPEHAQQAAQLLADRITIAHFSDPEGKPKEKKPKSETISDPLNLEGNPVEG